MKRNPDGQGEAERGGHVPATPVLGLLFLSLGCLLVLPIALGASGDREDESSDLLKTPRCGRWHRGSGGTDPLDLGAVKEAYKSVARRLDGALADFKGDFRETLNRPHNAGLPRCEGKGRRTVRLGGKGRLRLRGKKMYFMDARASRRLRLPKEVEGDLGVEIFILECRSILDLPDIAKRLKRPVNLATAVFARALGVRCSNTLIRISERGDEVYVHEGE